MTVTGRFRGTPRHGHGASRVRTGSRVPAGAAGPSLAMTMLEQSATTIPGPLTR
jgi:hypothetical protein